MPLTTINAAKDLASTYQPLLLATITFTDSPATVLRLSTHPLRVSDGGFQYGGNDYLPRILNKDIAATQALSEQGIDISPSVTLDLADADKWLWTNYEKAIGFKGAKLTLDFVFWDANTATFSSDSKRVFVGICNPATLDDSTLTVVANNLLSMQRFSLPNIRIQRRCPWVFPTTGKQREQAVLNEDSPFYYCGYGPDVDSTGTAIGSPPVTPHAEARGNFNAGVPYTSCAYTKADCEARGMYAKDNANPQRNSYRFGGVQWDPPSVTRRTKAYLSGKWEDVSNAPNETRYNDFFPLLYGTAWVEPPIINVVGDANLTKMEAVVCYGEIDSVLRVEVNDALVNEGAAGGNTIAGFWNYVTKGARTGAQNADALYTDHTGAPLGDPYGSLACIEVVVPRKLADASSRPRLRCLVKGPKVRVYTDPTTFTKQYSDNPAWIMMDLLVRGANWDYADLDIQTFIDAAAVCDVSITYTDLTGASKSHKRYTAALALRQRTSVAEMIRGLRTSCKAILVQNDGKLQVFIKQTMADQQGSAVAGSNYDTAVTSKNAAGTATNGFAAYKFDETNILTRGEGDDAESTLKITQRGISDAPNRVNFAFQDEDNEYVRDSLGVVETADVVRAGQEVSANLSVEGIKNYDQGKRISAWVIAEALKGNTRNDTGGTLHFEWDSSFRGIHLRVGHICLLSSAKHGLTNQKVRITSIRPSTNFQTVEIGADFHNDDWYVNTFGQEADPLYDGQRRNREERPPWAWQPYEVQAPSGDPLWPSEWMMGIAQVYETAADGTAIARLRLTGKLPVNDFTVKTRPPFVPLQGTTASTGGSLAGGKTYYAVVCAKDTTGSDYGLTAPSVVCQIVVPSGTSTNTATIPDISWAAGSVGYQIFFGTDPSRLPFHSESDTTPASIIVTSAADKPTYGPPDHEFDRVLLKVRRIMHAGVIGEPIDAVTATTLKIDDAGWATNEWANRVISIIAFKDSDGVPETGAMAVVNRTVSSNTADTLTVAGDLLADGVAVGDVLIMRSKPESPFTKNKLKDTKWVNPQNAFEDPKAVTGATNATPIVITVTGHGYATGDKVRITGVLGNTAANNSAGYSTWTVTNVSADTFSLDGSAGNGAYTGGGVAKRQVQGLRVNEETGRIVRFIAGTGRGKVAKVKSNTKDELTLDGDLDFTPDATSLYIIEEPEWQVISESSSVDNNHPLKTSTMDVTVDNLLAQTVIAQAVLVDGGDTESFEHQNPFREIYLFGSGGETEDFQASIILTVDGTLAIGSDLAPMVSLGETARATGVRIVLKQAPTGAAATFEIYVNAVLWMTLTVAAGQTSVTATQDQVDAAADIGANQNIRVDITAVGTTFPGADASVQIRL